MSGPAPDEREQLACSFDSCVLADRSDFGRLTASGADILDLLNRLSTADLSRLDVGEGKPTVLTTPKGRIVERLFVHRLEDRQVLMIGGRGCGPRVLAHLGRYTFAEDTGLCDPTESTCQWVLVGPRCRKTLEAAGLAAPLAYASTSGTLRGIAVHVLGHDGLSAEGLSVMAPTEQSAGLRAALAEAVASVAGCPAGALALEANRILRGIPAPGQELTERYNPLEAGLWDSVSFDKGCYVGQEVVARLNTYEKVSRSIVGLELPASADPPPAGTGLVLAGREVGELTSVVRSPDREIPVGLGCVKRKEIRPGLDLQAGSTTARLVPLPFDRPPD